MQSRLYPVWFVSFPWKSCPSSCDVHLLFHAKIHLGLHSTTLTLTTKQPKQPCVNAYQGCRKYAEKISLKKHSQWKITPFSIKLWNFPKLKCLKLKTVKNNTGNVRRIFPTSLTLTELLKIDMMQFEMEEMEEMQFKIGEVVEALDDDVWRLATVRRWSTFHGIQAFFVTWNGWWILNLH